MGAFGLIYVIVFLFIVVKAVQLGKKNGFKEYLNDPGHQSPAYKAAVEPLQARAEMMAEAKKGSAQNGSGNLSTLEPVVSRPINSATTVKKEPMISSIETSKAYKAVSAHTNMMSKEPAVNRLMDDREHDWLARQLRDERVAKYKMSEMFELKREHAANCDAEMLKRFHAENCDADGIDTART